MRYISTRGAAPALGFEDVLLAGLAPDGGLYLPESWPPLPDDVIAACRARPFHRAALAVIAPFVDADFPAARLAPILEDAYRGFDHPAAAPLVQIDDDLWLLELFHGPTLAFKDFALQLLGRLFDDTLRRRGEQVTVVGATSGDTGSAAIHACKGRDNIRIFILHPHERVSPVQRRQMTTVNADNVHNIAIRGTFDDCQALVKAMFADTRFRDRMALSAINSINWARVMAQTVYYVTAVAALGGRDRPVAFSVPTGNFGDVYAGYVAAMRGLPISRLIVATNRNDILARVLATGRYELDAVAPTLSPSMDIQVASNFERLLADSHGRDGAKVRALMDRLKSERGFTLADAPLARMRALFAGCRVDEDETLEEIARTHAETGLVIDPHTAVGVGAARRARGGSAAGETAVPIVCLATAHPAKFPDAVKRAIGQAPPVPERLEAVMAGDEQFAVLDNDLGAVQNYIRERSAFGGRAAG